MSIRVITPPDPFVTPADIAGSHQSNDPKITAMIAAAIEEIDGYTGWLGRCLAPQLLEWSLSAWPCRGYSLPIGPELEIESVTYVDHLGDDQVWAFPTPLYFDNLPAVRGRTGDLRIRYWAGYGKRDQQDATNWIEQVPARAKQAVIMSVQHMKSLSAENLFLRSDAVEGVGTKTYTISDQASAIIHGTARRLLSGLKVPRI
jgi:hypothetical protein